MRAAVFVCLLVVVSLGASPVGAAEGDATRPKANAVPVELFPELEAAFGDADVDVAFWVELGQLFAEWPGLSGLEGLARVRLRALAVPGTGRRVGIERLLRIEAREVRLGGVAVGRLSAVLRFPAEGGPAELGLRMDGAVAVVTADLHLDVSVDPETASLRWGEGELTGRVSATSLDLGTFARFWPWLALGGLGDLTLDLDGSVRRPTLAATLRSSEVSWRGQDLGGMDVAWQQDGREASIAFRLGEEAKPLFAGKARLPMDLDLRAGDARWRDKEGLELDLRGEGLSPERLRPFYRAPVGATFDLDLAVKASGTLDRLAAEASLAGSFTAGTNPTEPLSASLVLSGREQRLLVKVGDAGALVDLDWTTKIPLAKLRRRGAGAAQSALSGRLALDLDLPTIAPFLPAAISTPKGHLKGTLALSGKLGSPKIDGLLKLNEASLTLLAVTRRVRDVSLQARFKGSELILEQLRGGSSGGSIAATGRAKFLATAPGARRGAGLWSAWILDASLQAELEAFPLVRPDMPVALCSGGLSLELSAKPGEWRWDAALPGMNVILTPERVPNARAVPANRSVRVLDWLQRDISDAPLLAGEGHLSLSVRLPEPVRVQGDGSDLSFAGGLRLERIGPVVRVEEGLEVLSGGHFQLFDRDFELRGGVLSIAEGHLGRLSEGAPGGGGLGAPSYSEEAIEAAPLDPIIDLAARAVVLDTHVLLRVRGPGYRPVLIMESVPALPEYQILSLLILGRVDTVDDQNGEVRREAAKLVERFHNPSLKKQLFDRLGVDKVGLGFGSSVSQPIMTVGKQVTRRIYVETTYRHNAPPDANARQGTVEYRLSPHWTVDTTFGDAAEGGFGLFWETRFGGPPPPGAPEESWGELSGQARGDQDQDGVLDPFDLCREHPEDMDGFEDEDGCPELDNDRDGVVDARDEAPLEPETKNGFEDEDGAPDVAPMSLQGLEGRIRSLRFASGSVTLARDARPTLRALAKVLELLPAARVEFGGHGDHLGDPRRNRRVSLNRAQAARSLLRRFGISSKRVDTTGYGYDQPLDPSETDEARAKNRRVEVRFFSELRSK